MGYPMASQLFNLIVTHLPGRENYITVLEQLKRILGDELIVVDSRQSLISLKVRDPYRAVNELLRKLPGATPILRIIPVDTVTDAYIHRIAEVVHHLVERKVPKDASIKISIDGHPYDVVDGDFRLLHKSEAIEVIARGIKRKVNLSKPDWIIYVKIVRLRGGTELAAVTVCRPDEIVSLVKLRRRV